MYTSGKHVQVSDSCIPVCMKSHLCFISGIEEKIIAGRFRQLHKSSRLSGKRASKGTKTLALSYETNDCGVDVF